MARALLPFARLMRFRAEALGFEMLAGLARLLGPDRASAVSGAMWRRIAPLNKRHARAEAQMRQAFPDWDAATVAHHLEAMWDNLGRTMGESFHIGTLVKDRARFEIGADTLAAVEKARAEGAVFVSLHQGNWELAAPLLDSLGLPVAGIYQRLQNPFTEARAAAYRKPFYALGLHSKGHDTARTILKLVAGKGTVAIMADLRDLTGISVPFFGQMAPSTAFPALVARTRGVPLFAGVVLRERGARFRIRTVEIPVPRSADRDLDIRATVGAIQAQFEEFVRAAPEQWMWGHRRWQK